MTIINHNVTELTFLLRYWNIQYRFIPSRAAESITILLKSQGQVQYHNHRNQNQEYKMILSLIVKHVAVKLGRYQGIIVCQSVQNLQRYDFHY